MDGAEDAPRVAVIVVNYGSSGLLERNLAPITDECRDVAAVVVDNHSTAEERRAVSGLADRYGWILVPLDRNVGFGAGVNRGVAAARQRGATMFLMLNPDASISCGAIAALRRRLDEHPQSLVAPVILDSQGAIWFKEGTIELDRGRTPRRRAKAGSPHEWPWLCGACLMTSAQAWDAMGGFDEDYFLYWEDVDLSVRAMRSGIALEVVEDAVAVHEEGGTQQRSSAEDFSWDYYYYNIRNRLLFAAKQLDADTRRRWDRTALPESYRVLLRGGGRRKLLRPWKPMASALRGLRDGRRAARALR